MKRFLSAILCFSVFLTLTACGKKEELPQEDGQIHEATQITQEHTTPSDYSSEVVVEEPTNSNDNIVVDLPPLSSDTILYAEESFDIGSDAYNAIKKAQGKISYISSLTTGLTFVANGEWYSTGMGDSAQKNAIIPTDADNIIFYHNMSIGENLVYTKENELFSVGADSEIRYNNVAFNPATDVILYDNSYDAPYLHIISKTVEGYIVNHWGPKVDEHSVAVQNKDGSYTYELLESAPVGAIMTAKTTIDNKRIEGTDISAEVVEIFALPNHANGYEIVVKTVDNDIYYVKEIVEGDRDSDGAVLNFKLKLKTHSPELINVDKLFMVETFFTAPVYSKCDNNTRMFTKGVGKDLFDPKDDVEIVFTMPDGLTTDRVVSVFSVSNAIGFVFDNGDVYLTYKLDESGASLDVNKEYSLLKNEDLSRALKEQNVVMFVGETVFSKVYMLTQNGYLLFCDVWSMIVE